MSESVNIYLIKRDPVENESLVEEMYWVLRLARIHLVPLAGEDAKKLIVEIDALITRAETPMSNGPQLVISEPRNGIEHE